MPLDARWQVRVVAPPHLGTLDKVLPTLGFRLQGGLVGVIMGMALPALKAIDGVRVERITVYRLIWGFPKIRGTFLGGPHNKDYSNFGSTLGSTYFGKLTYRYTYADTHQLPKGRVHTVPAICKASWRYCLVKGTEVWEARKP